MDCDKMGKVSKEMIRQSFIPFALTRATDGSQDDDIACLIQASPANTVAQCSKSKLISLTQKKKTPVK